MSKRLAMATSSAGDNVSKKTKEQNNNHRTKTLIMVSTNKSLYTMGTKEIFPYLNKSDGDIPATAKIVNFPSSPIRWAEILGSCNGIVLAVDVAGNMFLINPTTQELSQVPPSPFKIPKDKVDDHEVFNVLYGFGYDSLTHDFKVVRLLYADMFSWNFNRSTYVSVYSLRNNSWKKLPKFNNFNFHGSISGVLVNNKYHWSANAAKMLVFSFADEVFSEIKLLENKPSLYYKLAELGGKLAVYYCFGARLELWVMKKYGIDESWARVYVPEYGDYGRPLCLVEGSNQDMVFEVDDAVVVYDKVKGKYRRLRTTNGPTRFISKGTFVESTTSLMTRVVSTS